MSIVYRNVTRLVTLPRRPGILLNFGKLSLEQQSNTGKVLPLAFLRVAFRHMTGAVGTKVPCITMGLCNSFRYKCDVPINKEKRGEAPCLTP